MIFLHNKMVSCFLMILLIGTVHCANNPGLGVVISADMFKLELIELFDASMQHNFTVLDKKGLNWEYTNIRVNYDPPGTDSFHFDPSKAKEFELKSRPNEFL